MRRLYREHSSYIFRRLSAGSTVPVGLAPRNKNSENFELNVNVLKYNLKTLSYEAVIFESAFLFANLHTFHGWATSIGDKSAKTVSAVYAQILAVKRNWH